MKKLIKKVKYYFIRKLGGIPTDILPVEIQQEIVNCFANKTIDEMLLERLKHGYNLNENTSKTNSKTI